MTVEARCERCGERFSYERRSLHWRPRLYCDTCRPLARLDQHRAADARYRERKKKEATP